MCGFEFAILLYNSSLQLETINFVTFFSKNSCLKSIIFAASAFSRIIALTDLSGLLFLFDHHCFRCQHEYYLLEFPGFKRTFFVVRGIFATELCCSDFFIWRICFHDYVHFVLSTRLLCSVVLSTGLLCSVALVIFIRF